MNTFADILIQCAGTLLDWARILLTFPADAGYFPLQSPESFLVAFSALEIHGNLTEGVLSTTRRWNGRIDDKFNNIAGLTEQITEHRAEWNVPEQMLLTLTNSCKRLSYLIMHSRGEHASRADRMERNSLLRATVSLCRTQVKFWALNQFAEGKISITDVHLMGFLVPGETGGRHGRKGETNVLADIRVHVLGPDFVRVSLSNSYGKNAAQAAGGWPAGVRFALIVITAVDGNREIVRRITTRLRNTIQLPQGLHGRQFLVEASFLKHVDDVPRFSSQQTFTLPYMTEDITANLSHKQNESKNPEMEALRKQMERLTVAVEGLMKDRGADPVGQKPR